MAVIEDHDVAILGDEDFVDITLLEFEGGVRNKGLIAHDH